MNTIKKIRSIVEHKQPKVKKLAKKIKQRIENINLERQPKADFIDLSLEESHGFYRVGNKIIKTFFPR